MTEREIGIEWRRGESNFTIGIDIPTNKGYIQEYTKENQTWVEDYPTVKDLMKRSKHLIKKRLI